MCPYRRWHRAHRGGAGRSDGRAGIVSDAQGCLHVTLNLGPTRGGTHLLQIVAEQSHRGVERGGPMTKMAAAYEALRRKDTLVKWLKGELGSAADRGSV
eukprot:37763-Eustigmatos_ZCMA.PRE.1